jgi:uncharacterized protein YjbI with pentapeptide repeats
MPVMLLVAGVVGLALPVAVSPSPAAAASTTFVVNDLTDRSSASCDAGSTTCTLRAAVAAGNALPGGGAVILLPAGTHSTAGGRAGDTGDIDVLAPMTILGPSRQPGSAAATVTGAGDRVLEVDAPGVVVSGVVLTGGSARGGAGVSITGRGDLTLTRSTVTGNTASDEGGAVANAGRLTLDASTLAENTAGRRGGALSNAGTAMLVNTTVHGNTANAGGGIISTGAADLSHVTITGNSSTNRLGGGLQRQGGTVSIRASIIAGNNANSGDAKDCSGSPFLDGLNLIGNPAGCNPTGIAPITGEPGLAAGLADNGGPTQTRALVPASPALDRIAPPCGASVDQRGVARPGGGGCDLGAYELEVLGLDLTLNADVTDTGAGAASVPLAALRTAATGPTAPADGTTAATLRSITLRSITLRSITLRSITLRSITLRSITLRSITLRSITLRSIDEAAATLRSITLRSITLRSILLSDVEVTGGWEALLAGTAFADVPLQNLTLEDVIDLPQVAALSLDDVDLSATRIGSLSLATLLLGTTTLRSIPLDPAILAAAGGDVLVAWCQLLGADRCAELGLDPSDPSTFDGVSLLTLDLAGVDLEAIALASILLTDLDLATTTLRSIPISELEPGSVGDIVDCALISCATSTLGDAEAAGALRGTMADLVLALVGDGDLGWEDADLEGGELQPIADPVEPTFTYSLGVDLRGGAPADVDVVVTLPGGFALDRGTSALDGAAAPDPAVDGRTLRFTLDDLQAGHHVITFEAWAGLRLGSATTTAEATATAAGLTARSAVASENVDVDEAFEGGAAADTGYREIGDDRLHLAHLSRPADVDLYRFEVTEDDARRGATATIRLANLPADYDLALYGPPNEPLRNAPTEARDLLPDHLLDTGSADDALTAEPTADVPQVLPFAAAEVIHRISARRSDASEQIDTGSLRAGSYWVQVSGANGAYDDDPYSLRIRFVAGIDRGPCAALPFTFPTPAPSPASTPTGIDTAFLVNRQRLAAAFGPAAAPSLAALDQFAARTDLGFRGAVVNVDGDGLVRNRYATWDTDRCSPGAANDVVAAIGGVLDAVQAANPGLTNVVVIGDDLQIPFARVPDGVALSNEQSFADELAGNNELVAALARGYVLTDNAYGASAGIAVNDHELFVPELAVGRLVETPDEITGALTRYTAAGGVLDVRSALVTGYDFLADGAEAVATALGDGTQRLIDQPGAAEPWDRERLVTALEGLEGPAVASINAHFDHTRALPSLGNSTGDESDLFTTADIDGPVAAALDDALLFSMGCHSGLSVADITVGAVVPDWAQTFAGLAGGWVANTGFGYGDTELVALSEDLMARFAAHLADGDPAGQALAAAKQDYAGAVALVGPYDEKVLHQATLYGLPMLRLGEPATAALATVAAAPPPVDPPITTDLHTGLPATTRAVGFAVATSATDRGPGTLTPASTGDGDYFHVDGDTLNQAHRPVEPRASFDLTRADGREPTGALVTSLTSVDLPSFDPLFFSPTVDLAAHEPRSVAADATFPSRFVDVTSTPRPGPDEQRLVVVPGQFRASTTAGIGTQRLLTDVGTVVYYGDPASAGPPIGVRQTVAATTDGTARFQVDLDRSAVRVFVLYKQRGLDTGGAAWTGIDLLREPGSDRWFGQGPGADPLEYIVQAVGPDGQVYWATSKGTDFGSVPGGSPPALQVDIDGPAPIGGWHPGAVTVTATGVGITYSLDGGAFQPYTGPIEIASDGLHTILFRDANGSTETRIVHVDATGPTAAASAEPASAWTAGPTLVTITAADGAGSGVASITYRIGGSAGTTVNGSSAVVEVATEGQTTIHFMSTDAAGNVGPESSITVRIDTVRPVVACGSASSEWVAGNASIPCTASDPGSGLANPADASFSLVTAVPTGTETASASTGSRQVCDVAGNCTMAGPVGGNLVDGKGPVITITSPVAGALVGAGSLLTAAYGCADGGSGVASCTAAVGTTPVASGGALPTSARGTYTLVVTSRDTVGNVSTASATYAVGYGICLQYDPTKPTSIGAAVPIRLQLCEGTRNVSSASIVVEAISIDGGPPPPPNFQGSSNLGNRFRLDGASKTYTYNLDTTGLSAGPHVMHLRVGGATGSGYFAPFTLTT